MSTPLYCSPRCRQSAELVRYVRARRKEGRESEPDIAEAIRTKLAMVLGGGYPERERYVSEKTRKLVFQRARGRCQQCGRLLVFDSTSEDRDSIATIQHASGNSNDPRRLLAFCRRCNLDDARSRFVPVEPDSREAEYAMELRHRWSSPTPIRICDDDARWNQIWRDLAKRAKETIQLEVEKEGSYGDVDLPGFQGWTDQGTPIQDV